MCTSSNGRYFKNLGQVTESWLIVDKIGRKFRNLRVSLTACNYACDYCVPDGKRLSKASNELSASELLRAVFAEGSGRNERLRMGEPNLSGLTGF